ncbi:MAG: hypothetical protein ACK4E3_11160 [Brevundimonas sp.]|jgi:hypothetical protein|uniref:hypothetical protein n=1 Tax=Brevundimonas sp. TaxID=1871086 RepID=UPI0039194759
MTPHQLKHFIGDVARPFCLIAVGAATAWAIVFRTDVAAIVAAGTILAALYGAKAMEVAGIAREQARHQGDAQ